MNATQEEVQQYIRFVLRCGITTSEVIAAFNLATTFGPVDQIMIVRELKTFRKEWNHADN